MPHCGMMPAIEPNTGATPFFFSSSFAILLSKKDKEKLITNAIARMIALSLRVSNKRSKYSIAA